MSKIQISELNVTASEFTALNDRETADVVGGRGFKFAKIYQNNDNSTLQLAFGGGKNSPIYQYNETDQSNSAKVYQ
jgi:hypothetical protein